MNQAEGAGVPGDKAKELKEDALFKIGNRIQATIVAGLTLTIGAQFRTVFDRDPQGWAKKWAQNQTQTLEQIKAEMEKLPKPGTDVTVH